MTRRAWARGLLVLLTAAGIALFALHWQGGDSVRYIRAGVKPVASVEPYTWPSGPVNVNTADADALQALEGMSKSQIEALLMDRAENGAFDYPEDLVYVKGIGEKTLAKVYDQLDFSGCEPGN